MNWSNESDLIIYVCIKIGLKVQEYYRVLRENDFSMLVQKLGNLITLKLWTDFTYIMIKLNLKTLFIIHICS